MSLDSLIAEYNEIEAEQIARLHKMFETLAPHPGAVLVLGGPAGEERTEEIRGNFSPHQFELLLARRSREITFWGTGSPE